MRRGGSASHARRARSVQLQPTESAGETPAVHIALKSAHRERSMTDPVPLDKEPGSHQYRSRSVLPYRKRRRSERRREMCVCPQSHQNVCVSPITVRIPTSSARRGYGCITESAIHLPQEMRGGWRSSASVGLSGVKISRVRRTARIREVQIRREPKDALMQTEGRAVSALAVLRPATPGSATSASMKSIAVEPEESDLIERW